MTRFIVAMNKQSSVLASWFARSYIAGRDGNITCVRNTNRTNPADGSTVAIDTPATLTLNIGGLPITAYGCWGTRTNLLPWSGMSGASVGNYPTGWSQVQTPSGCTITVISAGIENNLYFADFALSGTAYNSNAYLIASGTATVPTTGSITGRWLGKVISGTIPRTVRVNGNNGSPVAFGSPNTSSINAGPGTVLNIYETGTANVTGAENLWIRFDTNIGDVWNHVVRIYFQQLEMASFPGPYIPTSGSPVTHNIDVITWKPPKQIANSIPFSLVALSIPYIHNYTQFPTPPGGFEYCLAASTSGSNCVLTAKNNGNQHGSNLNGVLAETVNIGGQYTANTVFSLEMFASSTNVKNYFNGVSDIVSTLTTITGNNNTNFMYIGYHNNNAPNSFTAVIYTPGGLTDAERQALNSLKPSQISFAS